jgi:hypothetical protein
MTSVALVLTERQLSEVRAHLFPGDGLEAVAILLCGRRSGVDLHKLIARKVALIPYDACSLRAPDRVTWSTATLPELLNEAARRNLAVVKVHGHSHQPRFSSWDDASDGALFPSVFGWTGGTGPHGSAILMSDGRIFGRAFDPDGGSAPFSQVMVAGDDVQIWPGETVTARIIPAFAKRVAQSFGKGTFERLRQLKIAVVGCSGTGSPVIEQLARNCVGELVLVDPDRVEQKNLNRILNTTMADARARRLKVAVAAAAIQAMGLGTKVTPLAMSLFDPRAVTAVADCDIVFGCMDTVDGRHLLNKLATFYSLPYFDLGVKLEADGRGGVDQVCGTVHYLKPGGSSLLSRRVYTLEQVRAAGLSRTDPATFRKQVKEGYIKGVAEDRPAVIQLNSLIASFAVNELLARLHPYRLDPNGEFAVHRISLSHGIYEHEGDGEPCPLMYPHVGRGDIEPLLDWPELSVSSEAA